MVKLKLVCESCGNEAELVSDLKGHQVQMFRLNNQDFRVDTPDFDRNGNLEDYEDIDDVDIEIRSIRINCTKCGDYIVLENF